MQPAKLPPSSPPSDSSSQKPSAKSVEKTEKAESSWLGSVVTRLLHAIGYVETRTGKDTALADRHISYSDPGRPEDTETDTQSETSITTDPEPAIAMEPEEVLAALAEAVKAKDAARVQSLLASLQRSCPDQAAEKIRDILTTVLQDPSIPAMPSTALDQLKKLIDCLLAGCGPDNSSLANSALKLFFDRKHFAHAAHFKETYKANLEAGHLKIALDELVREYAPYAEPVKTLETALQKYALDGERTKALEKLLRKYASDAEHTKALNKLIPEYGPGAEYNKPGDQYLSDHGKVILGLANLQNAQSLKFAMNTLADGLEKCLEDSRWLRKLNETKYVDIVVFFEGFFNHGIKSEKLAYSLMTLCFSRLNYDRADKISERFNVRLTDKHLINALKNRSHRSSVNRVLKLATPGAAGKQIIKDTIENILKLELDFVATSSPTEILNFKDFIASYAWHLPGEVNDKLFLLNPLIEFCVRGQRIDQAQRLKMRFPGCYLEPHAYRETRQRVTLSAIDETEKSKKLTALLDLTRQG
ncbi:hypothetical protein [Endozoicomonas acroporae]|uniref:hypothetical protein n=1 Tax=Endozoicomonas acroporae TaxID=1701104 RepID=UPI0013CF4B17|nr:hypothetical protein [Endozoicomonas acroporae]